MGFNSGFKGLTYDIPGASLVIHIWWIYGTE